MAMPAMPPSSAVSIQSKHTVPVTLDRLAAVAKSKGLLIFARIDHGQGAIDAGLSLRPTQVLIFGNPKGGTPLMQDRQIVGLDLPLRALAWQDADNRVWLSYNSGSELAARHGLTTASRPAAEAIDKGIDRLCRLAASEDRIPEGQ